MAKNKTDVPFQEGYFKFIYETGKLDKIDELVSLGLLIGFISRKGPYYTLFENTFQGREAMETALLSNEQLYEDAKKEILSRIWNFILILLDFLFVHLEQYSYSLGFIIEMYGY